VTVAASSASLHEDPEVLSPESKDRHRAIVSIMEEFEAIDWYDQRVQAASDAELAGILAHNRDEEKEHMAMVLEWLRRHDAKLDEHLKTYLFKAQPPLEIEKAKDAGEGGSGGVSGDGSLGIGSLRRKKS
jgi:uncharacterized protein